MFTQDRIRALLRNLGRETVSFLALTYAAVLVLQLLIFYSAVREIVRSSPAGARIQLTIFSFKLTSSIEVFFSTILLILWLIYSGCFVVAWRGPNRGFLDAVQTSRREKRLPTENTLFLTVVLSSMVLFAVWVIQIIQESAGIPTGEIRFQNEFIALIDLSISPVIEEIFFRLFLIGIPAMIHLAWARREMLHMPSLKAFSLLCYGLIFPNRVKTMLQMRTIGRLEYVTIIVSSLVFGLTHFLSGAGWEIGKVSTAFLAGAVFAIAYVEYGFHVPILLHWFFNCYWTSISMSSLSIMIPGIWILYDLALSAYLIIGLSAWSFLLIRTLRRAKRGISPTL